jgi:hypothetical protein
LDWCRRDSMTLRCKSFEVQLELIVMVDTRRRRRRSGWNCEWGVVINFICTSPNLGSGPKDDQASTSV